VPTPHGEYLGWAPQVGDLADLCFFLLFASQPFPLLLTTSTFCIKFFTKPLHPHRFHVACCSSATDDASTSNNEKQDRIFALMILCILSIHARTKLAKFSLFAAR